MTCVWQKTNSHSRRLITLKSTLTTFRERQAPPEYGPVSRIRVERAQSLREELTHSYETITGPVHAHSQTIKKTTVRARVYKSSSYILRLLNLQPASSHLNNFNVHLTNSAVPQNATLLIQACAKFPKRNKSGREKKLNFHFFYFFFLSYFCLIYFVYDCWSNLNDLVQITFYSGFLLNYIQ